MIISPGLRITVQHLFNDFQTCLDLVSALRRTETYPDGVWNELFCRPRIRPRRLRLHFSISLLQQNRCRARALVIAERCDRRSVRSFRCNHRESAAPLRIGPRPPHVWRILSARRVPSSIHLEAISAITGEASHTVVRMAVAIRATLRIAARPDSQSANPEHGFRCRSYIERKFWCVTADGGGASGVKKRYRSSSTIATLYLCAINAISRRRKSDIDGPRRILQRRNANTAPSAILCGKLLQRLRVKAIIVHRQSVHL